MRADIQEWRPGEAWAATLVSGKVKPGACTNLLRWLSPPAEAAGALC